jgi:hypothetical protein
MRVALQLSTISALTIQAKQRKIITKVFSAKFYSFGEVT